MTSLHLVLGMALLALLVGGPLMARLLNWLDDREAARHAANDALTEFLAPVSLPTEGGSVASSDRVGRGGRADRAG